MSDRSQVTTRMAAKGDIAAVMELEQRTANAAHWGKAQYKQVFEVGPRRIMLLAEEADRLRGFLVAGTLGAEWEIENVAVDEAVRQRGIGRMLLQDLIARARAQQVVDIFLEVRESNGSARALYEKCAFVETGRRKAYFRNSPEDAILYRLSLAQNA